MGNGLPRKSAALGLVILAGVVLGGCDSNQDELEALESQVTELREDNRQIFDRLDEAEAERDQAQSQLSTSEEKRRKLRQEVFALRDTVDYLTSQIEATPDYYAAPPDEDPCQGFYDVGVDCPLDNLDIDPFD